MIRYIDKTNNQVIGVVEEKKESQYISREKIMLIQSKKLFLIILLIFFNKSIFAKQISIKEQQEFFCKLEQYDQCFYTGKCDYKDYVNYTDYFIKITGDINQNAKSLYDKLPDIYQWAGNDELSENFPHYIIYIL